MEESEIVNVIDGASLPGVGIDYFDWLKSFHIVTFYVLWACSHYNN